MIGHSRRIRELEGRNEALGNAIGEIRDAAYELDTTLTTLRRLYGST